MESVRSPSTEGPYPKDKSWGIGIVVLSTLELALGGGMTYFGALLGSAARGLDEPGKGPRDPMMDVMSSMIGIVELIGPVMVAFAAVRLMGGVGIIQGRRWGFVTSLVVSGLSILVNLGTLGSGVGVIGLACSGAIAYYCWMRLSKREGPELT